MSKIPSHAFCSVCGAPSTSDEASGVKRNSSTICNNCRVGIDWKDLSGPVQFREEIVLPWSQCLLASAKMIILYVGAYAGGAGLFGGTLLIVANRLGFLGPRIALGPMHLLLKGLYMAAVFCVIGSCLLGLVAIPMFLSSAVRIRRRSIDLCDGKIGITIGRGERQEWNPSDLDWQESNVGSFGWYSNRPPLVRITAGETVVCCGFDQWHRERWIGLLRLLGAKEIRPSKKTERVKSLGFAIFIGATMGALAGFGLAFLWDRAFIVPAALTMGMMDGLVYLLFRRRIDNLHPAILETVGKKSFPIAMFLGFCATGMTLALGQPAMWAVGLLHGFVGILMAAKLLQDRKQVVQAWLNEEAGTD